jgi:hypothetical protein
LLAIAALPLCLFFPKSCSIEQNWVTHCTRPS